MKFIQVLLSFVVCFLVGQSTAQRGGEVLIDLPTVNICPINEVYRKCGMRCTEDCDKDLCKRIRVPCEEGCFCESDLMVRINGVCVSIKECPPKKCPPNSSWMLGNQCTGNCGPILCDLTETYDCYCDKGFVNIGGECRPEKECWNPPECRRPFEWRECGNQCENLCPDEAVFCGRECVPGCYCPLDTVYFDGKCVPKSEYCPITPQCACGANETWTYGNECTEMCGQGSVYCEGKLRQGCFCKDGFVRIDGKCVPERECYNCKEYGYYDECGDPCQNLCSRDSYECSLIDRCVPGCYCPRDQVLVNRECVPKEKACPQIAAA